MEYVKQSVLKGKLCINTSNLETTRHLGEYNSRFQHLKWLTPSNRGSVLTACRRSRFLLTYTGPNELKLHIDVLKRLFYENLALDNSVTDDKVLLDKPKFRFRLL